MEKTQKHIIVTQINSGEIDKEDGEMALIFTASNAPDEDNGMYVRIISWDENKKHTEFNSFVGRKIKITIETID